MDEGDKLMHSAPPEKLQRLLSFLIPPDCREEVLGDLYEGCTSERQYVFEAVRLLPMVIFSRVRRTADAQVLLMQAAVLYLSFFAAGWRVAHELPVGHSGLLRLAIPPVWVVIGVMIHDAYAIPGKQSLLQKIRGPVFGVGCAYLSEMALSIDNRFGLPLNVMLFGSLAGLLFIVGLRNLFPPALDRLSGASAPALWLKYTPKPSRIAREVTPIVKAMAFVLALGFVGGQVGGPLLGMVFIFASILILIVCELRGKW